MFCIPSLSHGFGLLIWFAVSGAPYLKIVGEKNVSFVFWQCYWFVYLLYPLDLFIWFALSGPPYLKIIGKKMSFLFFGQYDWFVYLL